MSSYDKFVLILCFIVLTLLAGVFSLLLIVLTKQAIRLVKVGAEDATIYKKRSKELKYVSNSTGAFGFISTLVFGCLTFIIFGMSISLQIAGNAKGQILPLYRAVYSDSMSQKYRKNTYLFDNELDNQFNRFDLVKTYPMPAEEELQLYDVVVYEIDDKLIIHRIVHIEEPNKEHPDERWYYFQGDYVQSPDRDPVTYEQMRGIYKGERIKFAGSFIMFLQSPAGYACLVLIVIEMIAAPIMTKKIEEAEEARFKLLRLTGGAGGTAGIGQYVGSQFIRGYDGQVPDYTEYLEELDY